MLFNFGVQVTGGIAVTIGLSPVLEAWVQTQSSNLNATLTRIETKLGAMETAIMAQIDDLKAAVDDNIAAQAEQFAAVAAEDANIELAISKLTVVVGDNPAVQAQIDALKSATSNQRTANVAMKAENDKLALALNGGGPPPTP